MATPPPHAVCMPFPAQGHINAMMQLAKVLHRRGFHVTFVHNEFNYKRILKNHGGPKSLAGLPGFCFETFSDGLDTPDDQDAQDLQQLAASMHKRRNFTAPFRDLVGRLNAATLPVTCIISDITTSYTIPVAKEFNVPVVYFVSVSACSYLCFLYYGRLIENGLVPFKNEEDLTNKEYLDMPLEFLAGLKNHHLRLRDMPSFIRTTDPDQFWLNFILEEVPPAREASAIIVNTFDDLERDAIAALSQFLPPIYAIGPLTLKLLNGDVIMPAAANDGLTSLATTGSNLWKEDPGCLEWLDGREPGTVLYVNFGSLTFLTSQQLAEFAWGLANSGCSFLWVVRSNIVAGEESAALPEGFMTATEGRGMVASWCPQEKVLFHPAVGGFLTHCGWNSTIESLSAGVPMLCWPYFGDQLTNCRCLCTSWGIGMELVDDDGGQAVNREVVERHVREFMMVDGEKETAASVRKKVQEWKQRAVFATGDDGASTKNLDRVIEDVILGKKEDI